MNGTWQQILPVLISLLTIILVAVLQARSATLAAILATMPVTVPLSLWVVYAGSGGDSSTVAEFTASLGITMIANVVFVSAVWLAARAGWRLAPVIGAGYVTWGLAVLALMAVRRMLAR
jgi:hypothetical protein